MIRLPYSGQINYNNPSRRNHNGKASRHQVHRRFKKSSAKLAVDSNQAISHTAQEWVFTQVHCMVGSINSSKHPNTVKDEVSDMAAEIKQLKKELLE
nr:hypothetical protein [Piscirickettsia salmonis]